MSPDFNRKGRSNQEIWRQQRPEVQTLPVMTIFNRYEDDLAEFHFSER
ncbi:hypothetical protein J7E73_21190 [Paenibacillus albidus]|nr:hypothetical protein [Paenibacillus albidus]MBT2291594.1 hypothetical protein [Paenibacillus albidus]